MPNTKSAERRMRQNAVRRLRNRARRSEVRSEIKKLRRLVEAEQFEEAQQRLSKVYAVIDRTAQKGVIHRNTAARYKSRLARQLSAHATGLI